jgi:ABC-type bacteriocin/lantibiotic exporter with double-glycine peptidase domain
MQFVARSLPPYRKWLLLPILLALGCVSYRGSAHSVAPSAVAAQSGWQRVESVPAVRQTGSKDCGAAALSAVMGYWRSPMPLELRRERIDEALRESADGGLSAGALRDYARRQGFRAFVFHGALVDLRHEIDAGRPVVVGVHQELSSSEVLSHYQVLLGFHLRDEQVLLFDPARGLLQERLDAFLVEWDRAGRLTLVVSP